jgi:hypothetical protein
MRRIIFALVILCFAVNAAIDQSYEQTLERDGSSVIVKSMEVNIFAAELDSEAMDKVADTCGTSSKIRCSVDGSVITIEEDFSSGQYYAFTTDYGLFSIEHTLQVSRIPTDRFSTLLDDLLGEAGVLEPSGRSSDPIDLLDTETNAESVYFLRKFDTNITYTIRMPTEISEAYAGEIKAERMGDAVQFDLIEVMEEGQPMTVKSTEVNSANVLIIATVIVLAALAYSFFRSKPRKRRKK